MFEQRNSKNNLEFNIQNKDTWITSQNIEDLNLTIHSIKPFISDNPSTSFTNQSQTLPLQQPSTLEIQQSSTLEIQQPSTLEIQQPSTLEIQQQSTSKIQQPVTSFNSHTPTLPLEQPSTSEVQQSYN